MATISENLEALNEEKELQKIALENQGQDMTGVPYTQYHEKISAIKTKPNLSTKEITANGTYNASDDGVDGYSSVDVNVPTPDLSQTTATEEDVLQGKEFFNASGEKVAGTYKDMLQQRIDKNKSCAYLFYKYSSYIDFIQNLDTSKVKDMGHMFDGVDGGVTVIDVSNLDTSSATNMAYMFSGFPGRTLDLSNFDTSNVTNMSGMFNYCQVLENFDVSHFDTSNVTSMEKMFYGVGRTLTSSFRYNIDFSKWDTSKVTNTRQMFQEFSKQEEIDISSWSTKQITNFSDMFYECYYLKTIRGNLDLLSATTLSQMFRSCRELTNLNLKNIKISLTIGSGTSYGHLLTLDSLLNTIKELWTNTGTKTLTLTMGTANTAKLADVYVKLIDITDEMRAEDEYIDNKAPFVQCESTEEGAMLITEYITNIKKWQLA